MPRSRFEEETVKRPAFSFVLTYGVTTNLINKKSGEPWETYKARLARANYTSRFFLHSRVNSRYRFPTLRCVIIASENHLLFSRCLPQHMILSRFVEYCCRSIFFFFFFTAVSQKFYRTLMFSAWSWHIRMTVQIMIMNASNYGLR